MQWDRIWEKEVLGHSLSTTEVPLSNADIGRLGVYPLGKDAAVAQEKAGGKRRNTPYLQIMVLLTNVNLSIFVSIEV